MICRVLSKLTILFVRFRPLVEFNWSKTTGPACVVSLAALGCGTSNEADDPAFDIFNLIPNFPECYAEIGP
jgi:hypothetical protein